MKGSGEIDLACIETMILETACEDFHGLYEAVWEMNTNYPNATTSEKLQATKDAMSSLLKKQYVFLAKTKWQEINPTTQVSPTEYEKILSTNSNWERPSESAYFVFSSTKKGVAHLARNT